MIILAIDTATSCCGAAVVDECGVLAQFSLNVGKTHSQSFLPMVEALLTHAQLPLAEMSAIAVTAGPGSFTGLRIGIATAKAWGQSMSMPLIAIDTLEALDAAAGSQGLICPILDARKGEVYCALFEDGKRLWEDTAITPLELAARLKEMGRPVIIVGDGLAAHCEMLAEELGDIFMEATEIANVTAAAGAGILARGYYQATDTLTPEELEPKYLRLSEAEARLLKQEKP